MMWCYCLWDEEAVLGCMNGKRSVWVVRTLHEHCLGQLAEDLLSSLDLSHRRLARDTDVLQLLKPSGLILKPLSSADPAQQLRLL